MENQNLKDYLVKALINYAEAKAEPYVEKGVAKLSHIIGIVFSVFFFLFSFLIAIIFSGITVAIVIGKYTGIEYAGFLAVTILYLFGGWFVWLMRERLIAAPVKKLMLREIKELNPFA